MTIKAFNRLSETLANEILNLERVCIEHDNLKGSLFLDSSLNFDQSIKSFFLFYEQGELISMLSMFIPTKQEAEISAYTLPEFREQGYFKRLLSNAVEELRKYDIPDILFVCESDSIPGKRVLATLKTEYEHTEYFMRFHEMDYVAKDNYRLLLTKAELKDLEKTIATSMRIFDDGYEDAKSLIEKCFTSETREQYLAVLNGEIIGIGSVNLEEEDVTIYGLGLISEHRGMGYGEEFLHIIIDDLLQRGRADITIEVHSENINALGLYQKTGFQIEVAYVFYRKKVSAMM